ncbi:DHHC-type zinc finger family protein [Tasmannia lanceolata]|uniref:DHHC-type zinc finger family protein n=1 Tax=Tasmannia lanceolata TaxID=3420 RepID=UPI004063CDDC
MLEMGNNSRFLSLPVWAVFLLMGFVYYTTVFIFIEDWLGLKSSAGILNALFFSLFAFLCLISFFASILIEPGHVPSSFIPEIEDPQISYPEPKKNDARSKYCEKCCIYKPPRAHHCRVCRRCVLRMDHHCVWINNCVGYANYKPFIIFVMYAAIGCVYSMVMIISSATQKDQQFSGRTAPKVFYVLCGSIMVALSVTVGVLLGWHIYLLTHNMTTIEYHEGVRAMWLAKKRGQGYNHPFNLGVFENIISILGPNMLKWLCPIAVGHLKDGLHFPTSHDNL